MTPKKSEYEETDADKVPLRQVRRTLAVHMDKEKEKYFEWCRGKQKVDCPECDPTKNTKKHQKYWESKNEDSQGKHKDNCGCRGAHSGSRRRHTRISSADKDHKIGKRDLDRIVENAVIEWDFFKNKKKSFLSTLGMDKEKVPTEGKPKTCSEKTPMTKALDKSQDKNTKTKKKQTRDENDIYGEHIAMQLRKLKNPKTVALARLKIDKVIFNASIGNKTWTHKQLNKFIEYRNKQSPNHITTKAKEQSYKKLSNITSKCLKKLKQEDVEHQQ